MATNSQPRMAFPFLLRVTQIGYERDRGARELGRDGYWEPPLRSACYDRRESTGWWVWDPGQQEEEGYIHLRRPSPEEMRNRESFRTGTMFWDRARQTYLYWPENCLEEDLKTSSIPYRRLGFAACPLAGREHLVLVAHHGRGFELPLLGPERFWNRLLPVACKSRRTTPPLCTLAGDLAVIIGLIAFSTTPSNILKAISTTFRPNLNNTRYNANPRLPPAPGEVLYGRDSHW